MARHRPRRPSDTETAATETSAVPAAGTTGRFIVRFRPRGVEAGTRALQQLAGVRALSTAETEGTVAEGVDLQEKDIVFDKLGFAVISAERPAARAVSMAAEDSGIASIRPEMIFYEMSTAGAPPPWLVPPLAVQPVGGQGLSPEYLRGCRDMIDFLSGRYVQGPAAFAFPAPPVPGMPFPFFPAPGPGAPMAAPAARALTSSGSATWGLEAIRALTSSLTGSGVNVAILDTGFDLTHPDFAGRSIQTQSFVQGPDGQLEDVQDMRGHGTHCAGIACGPKTSVGGIRYGVASEANLFIGKVLSNAGQGPESAVIAGIEWAIAQGCRVVSMSLGIPWPILAQQPQDVIQRAIQDYEDIAQTAIQSNAALIAAAGNDSDRAGGVIWPVGLPALAVKILAVAAVKSDMGIANFSNGGATQFPGGAVDLAAPGVDIYSSWSQTAQLQRGFPPPGLFGTLQGTSQATPYVAGCAALMAQARPTWTAADILNTLMGMAKPLTLSSLDAGRGLVQAFQ